VTDTNVCIESAQTFCSPTSSNANIYSSSVTFTNDGKTGPAGRMWPFYLTNAARDLISEAQVKKKNEILTSHFLPSFVQKYLVICHIANNIT